MSVSARYLVWIEFGLVVCGDWHSSVFCRKKKTLTLLSKGRGGTIRRTCLPAMREDKEASRERLCVMLLSLQPFAPLRTHLLASFSLQNKARPRTGLDNHLACPLHCPPTSFPERL